MSLNLKYSLITALLCITATAHAQVTSLSATTTGANFTQPVPIVGNVGMAGSTDATNTMTPSSSNAIEFASEAGRIAGIAQACGQDISLFTNRTGEAINKLALNMPDKILATQSFQIALKQAQLVQTSKNIVPCGQALKDFSNLPILRSDYQQTVIANLNPDMNANNNPSQVAPNNPAVNPALPNTNYGTTPNMPSANQQNLPTNNTMHAPAASAPASMNQNGMQNGTALQQYIGK
jgi:hypothetical protein